MFVSRLVPVVGAAARAAVSFTADTTALQLVSFGLDMNAGTLLLCFTEPVDTSTFASSAWTLQSLQNVGGNAALAVTLTAASFTSSANGPTLLVTVGPSDLNASRVRLPHSSPWLSVL
jgi:hypothetical protein